MDFSIRFSEKVSLCEQIIEYSFTSKTLCANALNTAGDYNSVYVLDGSFKRMPKNDCLAVYGDCAANFVLCGLWLEQGDNNTVRLEKAD
ncbi:hypothetical protein B0T10DRAFT_295329 [Thelonectria olida]|uniref:Uncharacterized protein n=1 Tax=Thelonectria olida TaxID=1576542 RepID=A0A9P8W8J7_9HYPO|nr:hypothetical protein B0T10DRAFT_295329 [Thelonectria olida]